MEPTAKTQMKQILEQIGLSGLEFARQISVPADRIKDITSGRVKKISPKLANSIVEKFPQFSKLWLISGCGSMLNGTEQTCKTSLSTDEKLDILIKAINDLREEVRTIAAQQSVGLRMVCQENDQFAKTLPSQKNIG